MRYRTQKLRSGAVIQAGMNATTKDYYDRHQPKCAPYRAVVLRTMVEDSVDRLTARRRSKVLCDVILVKSQIALQFVQVAQRLGVNDGQPWVPRPSTRRISTQGPVQLQSRSARGTPEPGEGPTPFDDLDGDVVLVDFVEGDLDYPIITGAMEHERSLRSIVEGDGWAEINDGSERGSAHKNERYVRWGGSEFRVNAAGDILFDTVGATSDRISEAVTATGGQIRFRIKDEQRLTVAMGNVDVLEVFLDGAQVRIDLGEGATERLVLGDAFRTFINGFLSSEFALHQHLPGTFVVGMVAVTGQSGAVAPSALPPIVPPPAFTSIQMGEDVLSDLAKTKKT